MSGPLRTRTLTGILPSSTHHITTGCGVMHVTLCWDNRCESRGIKEIIATLGKSGGCASAQTQALSRALSVALRLGANPNELTGMLAGISCGHPGNHMGEPVSSCGDAIGKILRKFIVSAQKGVAEETGNE